MRENMVEHVDSGRNDPLALVIEAYKNQPHSLELVTKTHQAIWAIRGESIEMSFDVVPCPNTQEELEKLEKEGKRVGYLPPELSTDQSREILAKMFPAMQDRSFQKDILVTNDEDFAGWFDYEAGIEPPYRRLKEYQYMERIKKDGRRMLTLNEYIVAGQDSKLFTSQYLDVTYTFSSSRLGSRRDGHIVDAGFYEDGFLRVHSYLLEPPYPYPPLGGRTSGAKRA